MSLILKALRERLTRPPRCWKNRRRARRARFRGTPDVAATLPDPLLFGDADLGQALLGGTWRALGHDIGLHGHTIWAAALPDPRLEPVRQGFAWLEDLAALGNRAARTCAQRWLLDWLQRHGSGSGPGWSPELAGWRAQRWTAHATFLARGLEPEDTKRLWRGLAGQQRYLFHAWPDALPGLPQLRALAGLVWSGIVLPHSGHRTAMAELGRHADAFIDAKGAIASRRPEELAEALILLIWTARILEDAGQHAPPSHLSAIVRGVTVLRSLRMGDGSFARFHGGSQGDPDRLDHALAELRVGVQPKPPLAMGYCRLTGGRSAFVLDAAAPPDGPHRHQAHASTLAFEMSVGRQPLVVNAGPGDAFGPGWSLIARQTAAHSTLEIDRRSSARFRAGGIAARTFGPPLLAGPGHVSINQAQDATGQWLLATHDGYASRYGIIHERRAFVESRGLEVRGEDILSVPDARARVQCDKAARGLPLTYAVRFHLHPSVLAELDTIRQVVLLALPSGEVWSFRSSGGIMDLEESVYLDPMAAHPADTRQIVVRAKFHDYIGQVIWSFTRYAQAPTLAPAERETPEDGRAG